MLVRDSGEADMEEIPLTTPRAPTTPRYDDTTKVYRDRINELWSIHKSRLETKRVCHCLAEPFFNLCKDVHMATRAMWDTRGRQTLYYDEIKEYEGNIIVRDNRYVTWFRYDTAKQSYVVIHYDSHGTDADCRIWWIVQIVDKNTDNKCCVNTNDSASRLEYLEEIVVSRGDYLGEIYSDWSCTMCSHHVICTSLDCTNCYAPRFWRCGDSTCEIGQLRDDKICYKCKTQKRSE